MGTSRQKTESQLEQARAALNVRVQALREKGIESKTFKRDPQWRSLDARVRQISSRLRKVGEIEAVDQETARLKVANLARIAAEKAERKSGASKKPKPARDEGKKAKGQAKPAKEKKEKPPKEKKEASE